MDFSGVYLVRKTNESLFVTEGIVRFAEGSMHDYDDGSWL